MPGRGVLALARRASLPAVMTRFAYPAVTFGIGTLGGFWFIERVTAFWA